MKDSLASLTLGALLVAGPSVQAVDWTAQMKTGDAGIQSISQLAFGPEGILFVADSKSAAIVAIATGDIQAGTGLGDVPGLNNKIAALLGTSADQVLISDLAVNPLSQKAYVGVSRGRGPSAAPALVTVDAKGQLALMDLSSVKHSRAVLPDAPVDGVVGEGRRSSNPRMESITDIAFLEDRVLVAGLSNEEFSSTLRAIPFPFQTIPGGTSVEIYHGAHGRFETRSPVRTFVPFNVGDQPQLLAAYTCTPLVQFPLKRLQPGAKIKGKTIAELGNRNRPIDMIVYNKGGQDFLLMANSSRGVMKIPTTRIEETESITEPVRGGGTKGVGYQTIDSWKGIVQLDRVNNTHAVVLRVAESGDQDLAVLPLP